MERQVPEQIVARLVTELVQGKRRQGAKLSAYLQEIDQALQDAAAAREAFIRANLRLVVAIARKYRRDLLPLPDLIQ